jgi:hypothetical protein
MGWRDTQVALGTFRNAYKILVGKHESEIPLRGCRDRWEVNTKMGLREMWV